MEKDDYTRMDHKDDMDGLLARALRPELCPPEELNRQILSGEGTADVERQKRGIRKWYALPKAAVAAAALVLIGSAGVYAATQFLKTPEVTEHTISVGNMEYVDDQAVIASEEPASVDLISSEAGDETTKWLNKDVSSVNGYTNTDFTYDSYRTAAGEAGMSCWIEAEYDKPESVKYTTVEGKGYRSRTISATFRVNDGEICLSQSVDDEGVSEDMAYSVRLNAPTNQRTYTTKAGQEFTLVDDVTGEGEESRTVTYVMIAYDQYKGYLSFENLTDEKIGDFLEGLTLN